MAGQKPLVLIVEDSEDVVDLYRFVIVHAGYRVATAPDGAAGLAMIHELHPAVVLLDVMMPHMTGIELLEELAEEPASQRPPVIVNSGNESFRERALRSGARIFLQKPVHCDDLLAAIELALGGDGAGGEGVHVDRAAQQSARQGAARRRDEEREHLLAEMDFTAPEVQVRATALVRWLADYVGYGTASIEVLKGGKIFVVASRGEDSSTGQVRDPERSFAGAVIAGRSPLLVGDTASTPIFAGHPAVKSGERFYAGVPLVSSVGPIGALSITDHLPHRFHGEDMTVLDHLALGITRRYEAMAGVASSAPFVFDLPGVFTRDTLHLLLSTELQRAARMRDGVIEFALVQLQRDDPAMIARAADVVYASDAHAGIAFAEWAPMVLALLTRSHSASVERPGLLVALTALGRAGIPVSGTGLVQYRSAGTPLLSQNELERVTDEARAIAATRARGRVERIMLSSEPHADAAAP